MDNQEKIMVLGSNGNLGHCIVHELNKREKWEVIALARSDFDVTKLVDLETAIKTFMPKTVINTVAYNAVDACETDIIEQKRAIKLNVNLVEHLASVCRKFEIKLIQFSTNYVFDGTKGNYTEEDETCPINFYGLTKRLSEEVVLDAMEVGLKGCILRVSNLYGPKGQSKMSKEHFFEIMENASLKHDVLSVISDEKSCFTYTFDVAARLADMIDNEDFLGIYHFVNSTKLSWYEAIERYFKLMGNNVKLKPVEGASFQRKAKRPMKATLLSTRMMPMRSFDDALADYILEYKVNDKGNDEKND